MSRHNCSSVAALTLLLGTNDAIIDSIFKANYKDNLQTILNRLVKEFNINLDRIILVTQSPTFLGWIDAKPFADATMEIGHELNVTTVNMYSIFKNDSRANSLLVDGIHFSSSGSQLFFDNLWPALSDKLDSFKN